MLSDEQIWQLASQEGDTHDDSFIFNRDGRWSVLSFARAIESALSQSTEQGERDAEFDVQVNGEWVAGSSGPRDRALAEAMRYASQYVEEGPVTVYEVHRTFVAAMSPHGDGVNYTRAEGGEDGHPAADALRWAGFGPEDNQAMGEGLQDAAGVEERKP